MGKGRWGIGNKPQYNKYILGIRFIPPFEPTDKPSRQAATFTVSDVRLHWEKSTSSNVNASLQLAKVFRLRDRGPVYGYKPTALSTCGATVGPKFRKPPTAHSFCLREFPSGLGFVAASCRALSHRWSPV